MTTNPAPAILVCHQAAAWTGSTPVANIYYSKSAAQLLEEAQQTLDQHATSSATGRCVTCDCQGPCGRREAAMAIFSRSLRLPCRRPGFSRPELINARPVTDTTGSDTAPGSAVRHGEATSCRTRPTSHSGSEKRRECQVPKARSSR